VGSIQVTADQVTQWLSDIQNNANDITAIARQYMTVQEEIAGAGWIGDAQTASHITGARIEQDIAQLTTAVHNLVDTANRDLLNKAHVEQDGRHAMNALHS
jgi:uncharacterized protein YukE